MVFYKSFFDAIEYLPEEAQGKAYKSIIEYALSGKEPETCGIEKAVFCMAKPLIDANNKRYENGAKGGRPKTESKPKGNQNITESKPKQNQKITKVKPKDNQNITKVKPNVNVNDNVNVNNKNTMCNADANALFERLWKVYPVKRGKGQVSEADKCNLAKIGEEHMLRAMTRYIEDLKRDDWRKPQNGSTFFHSGYVDYLDDNYAPPGKRNGSEKPNKFKNFSERDNDYADLQAQLLRKGME